MTHAEQHAAVEFTPAGTISGIPLVQHQCARYHGGAYVSAVPSAPGDPYLVPGCGCRPEKDYLPLADGSVLVTREECACGTSVTIFRGTRWNDDDTPHDCAGEQP